MGLKPVLFGSAVLHGADMNHVVVGTNPPDAVVVVVAASLST